jgi:hypothetical protein
MLAAEPPPDALRLDLEAAISLAAIERVDRFSEVDEGVTASRMRKSDLVSLGFDYAPGWSFAP